MFTQGFTVAGSSLELLHPGERGVITSFINKDETLIKKLMAIGLIPGVSITLEQRFPSFVVKVGNTHLALDQEIARAIYVRLAES